MNRWPSCSGPWAYAVAVAVAVAGVGLATGARIALNPLLGPQDPFVTDFVTLLLTAWLCGLGPSVLALVLGGLAAMAFFMVPSAPTAQGLRIFNLLCSKHFGQVLIIPTATKPLGLQAVLGAVRAAAYARSGGHPPRRSDGPGTGASGRSP